MEWIHQQTSQNEYDARKHNPPSRLGVVPKSVPAESCFPGNTGYDKTQPEEWCDSGLDSFISSTSGPECAPILTEQSWSGGGKLDGADSDRLDSAIGDSINEDAVHSLSKQIGTVIIKDTADQDQQADQERDQIYSTLSFISDDGDTMLHLALIHEQWHLFQQLLELITLNPTWTPYLDIQNDLGQSALHLAVILGSGESVRLLLGAGASVELQERAGNTALHLAVYEQHAECVKAITASHRTIPQHLNIYNYKGVGALHLAVQKGKCDTIVMLLEAGADVNLKDQSSGRSPLHWAVEYQNCAAVELLVERGADVDQSSYAGHTPFYCALYRPNKRLQELLWAAGASDIRDGREEDEDDDDDDDEEEVEVGKDSDEEEFDDLIINGQRVL